MGFVVELLEYEFLLIQLRSNKQTRNYKNVWLLCGYSEEENVGSLFRQTSVLVFFKSFSGTLASPPALLDIGYNALDDARTVEEEMPPP